MSRRIDASFSLFIFGSVSRETKNKNKNSFEGRARASWVARWRTPRHDAFHRFPLWPMAFSRSPQCCLLFSFSSNFSLKDEQSAARNAWFADCVTHNRPSAEKHTLHYSLFSRSILANCLFCFVFDSTANIKAYGNVALCYFEEWWRFACKIRWMLVCFLKTYAKIFAEYYSLHNLQEIL